MRELTNIEIIEISGSGIFSFILPVIIGFCVGGPVGAVVGIGTVIATTGAKNLDHLYSTDSIPTFGDMVK